MKIGLSTISSAWFLAALTGCVERRVVYVPAPQPTAYAAPPQSPSPAQPPPTAQTLPPDVAQAPTLAPAVEAPATPPPTMPGPPPPTAYTAYAPDYYTWDGTEYVGVVNGQYVYWGGGGWIVAPPAIVFRFHGWERYHPYWRRHAVPYRRHYR